KSNNLLIRKSLLHVRSPLEKRTLLDSKWHVLLGAHHIGKIFSFSLFSARRGRCQGFRQLIPPGSPEVFSCQERVECELFCSEYIQVPPESFWVAAYENEKVQMSFWK
ncbi:hypothetical protein, partial [Nitrosospira multiformis]|uniref:hypothetical protein n=1 Tax=Nitrosospira multiformis TaxID=1231 RepID=UPI001C433E8B